MKNTSVQKNAPSQYDYMDRIGSLFTVCYWDEIRERDDRNSAEQWCCKLIKNENLQELIITAFSDAIERCRLLNANYCPNDGKQIVYEPVNLLFPRECCNLIMSTHIESFQFSSYERGEIHNMRNTYCLNCGRPLIRTIEPEESANDCGDCGSCNSGN